MMCLPCRGCRRLAIVLVHGDAVTRVAAAAPVIHTGDGPGTDPIHDPIALVGDGLVRHLVQPGY
jgi:hypothetical protein